MARDWKWEGRSYFQVSQGLEAGYVAVKYNANTFKARWCRSSFLDLLSLVHSQPFFDIGLEHLKLPYCYHCLLNIFSKILSSHTIVWILATAVRTIAGAWNYNIYGRLFAAGPRRQVPELCQRICRRFWLHPALKRGYHHDDVTLWHETAFRHLLELETALQNRVFGWNHGKQYGSSICNLLRPAHDHIGKEDCRLGWSECDGSCHGKCDRQMDYDCFISISKSAWPDSTLKTGLLGYFKQIYGSRTSDVFHERSHLHDTVWR